MDDLLRLSRDNIAETYLMLGVQAPGSEVISGPAFDVCRAPVDLSFCNFVVRLHLEDHPSGPEWAAEELAGFARRRKALKVFVTSGDMPSNVEGILESAGFRRSHTLVQMAACPTEQKADAVLFECETTAERQAVTEFMVNQFFGRQSHTMRSHIVEATVRSGHRLYRHEQQNKIIAAVMLTGMVRAVGLYNLCVLPSFRKKGVGSSVVHSVLGIANELGFPTCLQCEPSLERWYKSLGFKTIGIVQAFSLNPSLF